MRHHAAHRVFAHADVHDVRIAFGDRDRADRTGLEKTVGDVAPTDPHVFGLPQTAAGRAHVISLRVANDAGPGIRTPATKRTNRAPLHDLENAVVIIRRGSLRR